MNDDFRFEIVKHFGIIKKTDIGWNTELNLVSWRGKEPVYDIRAWNPSHERMSRGVSLTADELKALVEILKTLEV